MRHEILIFRKNKDTGAVFIDRHIYIDEEEIEHYALKKYREEIEPNIDETKYEYEARLDSTKH